MESDTIDFCRGINHTVIPHLHGFQEEFWKDRSINLPIEGRQRRTNGLFVQCFSTECFLDVLAQCASKMSRHYKCYMLHAHVLLDVTASIIQKLLKMIKQRLLKFLVKIIFCT